MKLNRSQISLAVFVILAVTTLAATTFEEQNAKILVNSPQNGSTVEDHSLVINYGFDIDEDFEYAVHLNGEIVENLNLLAGQGNERTHSVSGLKPGEHELQINVETESGKEYYSGKYVFETTEEPVAEIDYITGYANTIELKYHLFKDSNLSLELDGEEMWERSQKPGTHTEFITLEDFSGNYNAELTIKSGETEVSSNETITIR